MKPYQKCKTCDNWINTMGHCSSEDPDHNITTAYYSCNNWDSIIDRALDIFGNLTIESTNGIVKAKIWKWIGQGQTSAQAISNLKNEILLESLPPTKPNQTQE